MSAEERLFAYRAVRADGAPVRDVVRAADRATAARRLAQSDLVVIDLRDAEGQTFGRGARVSDAERVTILRQLAVMTRAGVDLLEAIETIATGISPRPAADRLRDIAGALRRGDPLARAFSEHLHGYPIYVYALIRAGEASGRLPSVLAEAADQVAFEEQVRRDLAGALTYPAFLTCAGFGAVSFLLGVVTPRFAAMVGDLSRIDAFPSLILRSGLFLRDNALVVAAVIAVLVTAAWRAAQTPSVRARLLDALRRVPGASDVLAARARMGWARVMGLALGAGLPVLEAAALARGSVADDARFSRALAGAESALRAGRPVEAAFAQDHALTPIDASLVRAGAKSGALPAMFALIATQHEANLRAALKRTTVVVEQLAIALVASAVGAIVIGLVTALTGIYETIG